MTNLICNIELSKSKLLLPAVLFLCLCKAPMLVAQQINLFSLDTVPLKPWTTKSEINYAGVYHFGLSGSESKLLLIFANKKWYAQIVSGNFNNDAEWVNNFTTLNRVRIKGNKFYSILTKGEFVCYTTKNKTLYGLKIYHSRVGLEEGETGSYSPRLKEEFEGKYTQASLRLLDETELKLLPKNELKLMRNEIYARYGLQFKALSEYDTYFRNQRWYKPQYNKVDAFLTALEKENIRLITAIENN